jgi:hypothetical protein
LAGTKSLQNAILISFFNSKVEEIALCRVNSTPKLCLGLKKINSNLKPIMSLFFLKSHCYEAVAFLIKNKKNWLY